jgi:hypothetical protein
MSTLPLGLDGSALLVRITYQLSGGLRIWDLESTFAISRRLLFLVSFDHFLKRAVF